MTDPPAGGPRSHSQAHPHRTDPPPDRGAPLRLLRRRVLILVIVLLLRLGTLGGRHTQVQLLDPATGAPRPNDPTRAQPRLTEVTIPAVRGRILDRHGVPLVDNAARPALVLDRAILADLPTARADALFADLAAALATTREDLKARTTSCGAPLAAPPPICTPGSAAAPAVLARDLAPEQALAIVERPERFPGVTIQPQATRAYPHPEGVLAPHVLGYLAPGATDDSIEGRTGLEEQYDEVLRGRPGTQTVREQQLRATVEARQAAGKAADGAAALVIDLADGGVRAMASYPTYDPAIWLDGASPQEYAQLTAPDAANPLISRATEVGLPPASTFKVVMMPAAIRAGNPLDGSFQCPSSYTIGGRAFRNFRSQDLGTLTWREALAVSCDTIFYDVAYRSWRAQGGRKAADDSADPFVQTAKDFGLGAPTGIDLPNEAAGRIPDRAWRQAQWEATKDDLCRRAETGYPEVAEVERRDYLHQIARENCVDGYLYRGGDAANFSIGQGDTLTTPLQMAQVFAAIATGGRAFTPQVADALVDPVTGLAEDIAPAPAVPVPLDPTVGAHLRDALPAVVTEGTAAQAFRDFPLDQWPVAGKTGTAEMVAGNDTSWFISYAPATAPRYVVAVVVSQAGLGSEAAVPISRVIHDELRRLP